MMARFVAHALCVPRRDSSRRLFQLERKLGEGGMGEVYLACDTALSRNVALKILPDPVSSNRFTQEATLAHIIRVELTLPCEDAAHA